MDNDSMLFRLYHRLCMDEMANNFSAPLRESSPATGFLRLSFSSYSRDFLAKPIEELYKNLKAEANDGGNEAFADALISSSEKRDLFGSILDQILYGILILPAYIASLVLITEASYNEYFAEEENQKKYPCFVSTTKN